MASRGRPVGRPRKKTSWNAGTTQLRDEDGCPVFDNYGKKIMVPIDRQPRVVTPTQEHHTHENVGSTGTGTFSGTFLSPPNQGNTGTEPGYSPRSYTYKETGASGCLLASDPLSRMESRVSALQQNTHAIQHQVNSTVARDSSQMQFVNNLTSSLQPYGIIRQETTSCVHATSPSTFGQSSTSAFSGLQRSDSTQSHYNGQPVTSLSPRPSYGVFGNGFSTPQAQTQQTIQPSTPVKSIQGSSIFSSAVQHHVTPSSCLFGSSSSSSAHSPRSSFHSSPNFSFGGKASTSGFFSKHAPVHGSNGGSGCFSSSNNSISRFGSLDGNVNLNLFSRF